MSNKQACNVRVKMVVFLLNSCILLLKDDKSLSKVMC